VGALRPASRGRRAQSRPRVLTGPTRRAGDRPPRALPTLPDAPRRPDCQRCTSLVYK
jgi:hypothetical protein